MDGQDQQFFAEQIRENTEQCRKCDLSYPLVDIPKDKTYIVIGGNTGIGYEAAKAIAIMGGHVIIACRNMTKAEKALKDMHADYDKESGESKKLNVDKMEVDLSSFSSTMKFIEEFKSRSYTVGGIICNAGMLPEKRVLTEDGYELMLQVNFLSQLLINLHLIPLFNKTWTGNRIVLVSSDSYEEGVLELDNMNSQKSFRAPFGTYGNSKLYQMMSMFWLSRHLKDKSISIFTVHPGFIRTQMTENYKVLEPYMEHTLTTKEGAATVIKAATDPAYSDQHALYFIPGDVPQPNEYSRNVERQDDLMKYSFTELNKYLPGDISDFLDM